MRRRVIECAAGAAEIRGHAPGDCRVLDGAAIPVAGSCGSSVAFSAPARGHPADAKGGGGGPNGSSDDAAAAWARHACESGGAGSQCGTEEARCESGRAAQAVAPEPTKEVVNMHLVEREEAVTCSASAASPSSASTDAARYAAWHGRDLLIVLRYRADGVVRDARRRRRQDLCGKFLEEGRMDGVEGTSHTLDSVRDGRRRSGGG